MGSSETILFRQASNTKVLSYLINYTRSVRCKMGEFVTAVTLLIYNVNMTFDVLQIRHQKFTPNKAMI